MIPESKTGMLSLIVKLVALTSIHKIIIKISRSDTRNVQEYIPYGDTKGMGYFLKALKKIGTFYEYLVNFILNKSLTDIKEISGHYANDLQES